MDGVLGRMSKDFIQDKFSEDEIQQALSRESDDYAVEVSYSPSQIKFIPKDTNSFHIPMVLTVEHHIEWPKDRCWHLELISEFGDDPHNDPKNHCRWVGIPFSVMLDKVVFLNDEPFYMMPAGTEK